MKKREILLTADELVRRLLSLSDECGLCLLDSCGVSHLQSHLFLAGIFPLKTLEIKGESASKTLEILETELAEKNAAVFFTVSYDFGLKLENITPRPKEFDGFDEPDVFLALFDCLICHDYDTQKTFLLGNEKRFPEIEKVLGLKSFENFENQRATEKIRNPQSAIPNPKVFANFTREKYIETVEKIQDYIKRGDTYQTNLMQRFCLETDADATPEKIFQHLRKNHPAPFAAFLRRQNSVVVSASPERFFQVRNSLESPENFLLQERSKKKENSESRISESGIVRVSPIKGTRRRGVTAEEDAFLRRELLESEKDRAENVMIVDLLRNDIGRVCKFGSVRVEKLCDLEEHPTLFHLVSTVRGELREGVSFSDLIRAVYPCGSITGAPKIRTMQIIDELETAPRGLSAGAVGYKDFNGNFDVNVAIRTLVISQNKAFFSVGGGITIDSNPADEYEESLLKAKALLNALNS